MKSICQLVECDQLGEDTYCKEHKCMLCLSPKYDYMLYCSEHICCNISCLNHSMVEFNLNDLNYIANSLLNKKYYNVVYFYKSNKDILINEHTIGKNNDFTIDKLLKTHDLLKNILNLYTILLNKYCIKCFIREINYIVE
jgi:hypothetical protein